VKEEKIATAAIFINSVINTVKASWVVSSSDGGRAIWCL